MGDKEMASRCLILGEGSGYDTVEKLWAEMLWLYVEENVTEFVTEPFGRMADLTAYAIEQAGVRYSALRVVNLSWRADLRAAIDESDYLVICLGPLKRMKKLIEYAQARQTDGKIKGITISEG